MPLLTAKIGIYNKNLCLIIKNGKNIIGYFSISSKQIALDEINCEITPVGSFLYKNYDKYTIRSEYSHDVAILHLLHYQGFNWQETTTVTANIPAFLLTNDSNANSSTLKL